MSDPATTAHDHAEVIRCLDCIGKVREMLPKYDGTERPRVGPEVCSSLFEVCITSLYYSFLAVVKDQGLVQVDASANKGDERGEPNARHEECLV